jgi:site-specific recombinase XerC
MDGMKPPNLPEQPVGVIRAERLVRLLKSCEGRDFTSRRDTAIILLLVDTGMRRAECVGMTVDDVDLDQRMVWVLGKGHRPRALLLAARPLRPWTAIGGYARSIDLRTCRTSGSDAMDP